MNERIDMPSADEAGEPDQYEDFAVDYPIDPTTGIRRMVRRPVVSTEELSEEELKNLYPHYVAFEEERLKDFSKYHNKPVSSLWNIKSFGEFVAWLKGINTNVKDTYKKDWEAGWQGVLERTRQQIGLVVSSSETTESNFTEVK